MTGGGNGRRGSSATWRSSLSRGLGLEGTWDGRTRPDPRAGDVAREPQQSRLKTFREKPCRKTRYHLRGSQHRIYYTSSSKDVEAEMEAEDAVSFVPVWEIAAHVQCGAGQCSEPQQPDSASCPCPSSPRSLHQPAVCAPTTSCDLPPRPATHSRAQHPSLPPPPRWIRASSHQLAARTPSNTSTTHPQPRLRKDCTSQPETALHVHT